MARIRENLIESISSTEYGNSSLIGNNFQKGFIEKIADHIIASGVTVQEGKPLEAFLHPIDTYSGLKAKYLVFKADTGEKVDNCFILRPDKDPAAEEALRSYASATDNETLAEDIYNWVGKGEPVQEWISVKDRLPEDDERIEFSDDGRMRFTTVLAYTEYGRIIPKNRLIVRPTGNEYLDTQVTDGWIWASGTEKVTHWMPLPVPPAEND